MLVLLQGAAAVCAWELGCRVPLHAGAAAGCDWELGCWCGCRVLWCVWELGRWCRCRCYCCVHLVVPAGCHCCVYLEAWVAAAAAGCVCPCALWSLRGGASCQMCMTKCAGAVAGCRSKVYGHVGFELGLCVGSAVELDAVAKCVPLQGVCSCQIQMSMAMCTLELGCWCRYSKARWPNFSAMCVFGAWVLVPLRGATAGCCLADLGRWVCELKPVYWFCCARCQPNALGVGAVARGRHAGCCC